MLLRGFSRGGAAARPLTPGRLLRRMGLVAALTVAVFLTERGAFQRVCDRVFGPRIDWHSDYQVSEYLYNLIVRRRLTDVPRPCLLLIIRGEDPPQAQRFDVFERPTKACMGADAATSHTMPRLFGLRVDRDTGVVVTASGTPGRFHPLR